MSGISDLQGGQADLELAACDATVLLRVLRPSTPLLTNLEKAGGGLDKTKINRAAGFTPVGNWTKADGVSLTNNPTVNDEESHGKGSPTRQLVSKAAKGIKYTPQEFNMVNMQNAWGFTPDAVTVSLDGGITIVIPELPADLLWQAVLLTWDYKYGGDVFRYWIANRANVGAREDQKMTDGAVDKLGVSLNFSPHVALPGAPVIFGACGDGFKLLNQATETGFLPLPTGITATPSTKAMTAAAGANHTQQLAIADSNTRDRTAAATYTSSDTSKATVSPTGLITAVAAGSATITAAWGGFTATCAVTVT